MWLTDKGETIQSHLPNKVITLTNQIFIDNETIYLIPKLTLTDNYSIPFGINKDKYDIRPSHLHDIACYYHKVIVVNLTVDKVYNKYLDLVDGKVICKDVPSKYLKVVDVNFKECNDLLKKGMEGLYTIPKYITKLFRFAVNFNINWLHTGKKNIDLDNLYIKYLPTCNII